MTRNSTSLPQLIKSGFEYHASSLNIKVTFSNGADFLTFRLRAEVTIIFISLSLFSYPFGFQVNIHYLQGFRLKLLTLITVGHIHGTFTRKFIGHPVLTPDPEKIVVRTCTNPVPKNLYQLEGSMHS